MGWLERLDLLRRERGLALLLITHDLRQAEAFCDRIVAMRDGRLVDAAAIPRSETAGSASSSS